MKLKNLNNFGKQLKINKRAQKPANISEKDLFVDFINALYFCWDRSNKMYDLYRVNLLEYEEEYYKVIEDLIMIKYGAWKTEIILWYVFGRVDAKGNIYPLIVQHKGKEDEEVLLSTPLELWDFLIKLEKNKEDDK